ncbi:hypothetical protein GIB67_032880 [Kingdonia uniflora]|uniref:Pentatricopeptide repeat-containing protein n=1 Tax=Kingdonia uniflora TaxID=39325 RepID=A0A7J7NCF0_9MAGN|nr:hypothetical protein GIB67_032880 [Kingdonia uniflora]
MGITKSNILAATLISLAENCTTMRDLKRIHAGAIRTGFHFHTIILAKVLRFAAVSPSGDIHYARRLFDQMPQPNTFFYNTLIRGYSKSENPSCSIGLFSQMRRDYVDPDGFTFTFLLKSRSRMNLELLVGDEIHGQVLKFGFCSYLFVQNGLIHLYATRGLPSESHRVFDEIEDPDVVSWSGLVAAHLKISDLDEARSIFDRMPERDVVSWTSMISGYSQAKQSFEALDLFKEMRIAGVRPDEVTMVTVISTCTEVGDLDAGISIHHYIEVNGFGWMISLCNALIDMYAKCGFFEGARRIFENMKKRSLITWNSMISAYANHGDVEEAIELFHKMVNSGVFPDGVTFLALLAGYTHKGLVEEGYALFKSMKRKYGVEAGVEHYGCTVDMLGKAGRLKQAYDLIVNMPIPSNDVVWGALLNGCRTYGDVDMGELVVKKLLELKPEEGGYYILLSDIYVAAGRQIEAIEMRQKMEAKGATKTPGCSWVGI